MVPWEKAKKRKRWEEEEDAGVNVEDQGDFVLSSEKAIQKWSVIEFRLFQLCSYPFLLIV